jgi:hypothetical protein
MKTQIGLENVPNRKKENLATTRGTTKSFGVLEILKTMRLIANRAVRKKRSNQIAARVAKKTIRKPAVTGWRL